VVTTIAATMSWTILLREILFTNFTDCAAAKYFDALPLPHPPIEPILHICTLILSNLQPLLHLSQPASLPICQELPMSYEL